MADQRISQLPLLVDPQGEDLLPIIDNPNGTPTSKKIRLDKLFGDIQSNTVINGTFETTANATFSGANTVFTSNVNVTGLAAVSNLTINSNGLVITTQLTPANSSIAAVETGKIFFDSSYLYIKVSNTEIKRVALSSF